MKAILLSLALLTSTVTLAAPQPIRSSVALKNGKFSQMIFESLEKKIIPTVTPRVGGNSAVIEIKDLIMCTRHQGMIRPGNISTTFFCKLHKGGWNELGRDIYGSGDKKQETILLTNALSGKHVKIEKDEAFTAKVIELNNPDAQGGTERNLLTCNLPTKTGTQMGLRPTCQLINAL